MLPLHEPRPTTTHRRSQPFSVAPLHPAFDPSLDPSRNPSRNPSLDPSLGESVKPVSYLDFSDLAEFQPVQDHYHHLGIEFSGAIAIFPSNPGFGVQPSKLVLMPQAGRTNISVQFHSLQRLIGACVTAAQQIKFTLFDLQDQPIAEQTAGNICYLAAMTSTVSFPTYQLERLSENIARAEFCSHAPFVLSSLFWG